MSKLTRIAVTALGVAAAVGFFARILSHAGAAATWHAIGCRGPLLALALAPFAMGVTLDACGTLVLLRALGSRTTLAQMVPVRLASEALHLSVPAGFVASDTATAMLLQSLSDVPLRDGMIATIARKWLVMRAHAVYIAAGALVGFSALATLARGRWVGSALPWALLASAVIPLGASCALCAGLLGRSTYVRLCAMLGRASKGRLGLWLEARRDEAVATDAQVARLRGARAATTGATLAFLGCWGFEALETALILRLVGADVAMPAVVAMEAGLSLVRSLAVAAPSGLGVVDFGYASVLPALGADRASTAAFVVLKRAKELVWVTIGYLVLATLRAGGAAHDTVSNACALGVGRGGSGGVLEP